MMRVMYFILSTPFLRHLLVVVGADIGSIGRLGLRMQRDVREPICQPLLVLFIPPPRDETLRAMRCVAAAHVSVGCCAYAWARAGGCTRAQGQRRQRWQKRRLYAASAVHVSELPSVMEALLEAP